MDEAAGQPGRGGGGGGGGGIRERKVGWEADEEELDEGGEIGGLEEPEAVTEGKRGGTEGGLHLRGRGKEPGGGRRKRGKMKEKRVSKGVDTSVWCCRAGEGGFRKRIGRMEGWCIKRDGDQD